jgi:cyanate permease
VTDSQNHRGVLVPIVLFGMYAGFGAAWMAVVPLFPEIEGALDVKRADAAWLVTIVSLAKSVVPSLAGVAAARFGLTSTLRAAAILMSLSVIVPWLPGFPLWVAARFCFGVGGAIWLALMGAVVVDAVAAHRRGFVNALNGVAVNTGAIVGLKTALPLKDAVGFQGALTILGGATVLFLVVLLAMGPLSSATATSTKPVSWSALFASYRSVLAGKTTWIIALAFMGPLALYLVINTWLPSHLQAAGMDRPAASSWLGYMNLWGIPASLVIGLLLQKHIGPVRLHIVIGAVLLPLAMWGSITAVDDDHRFVFFALAGIGMFLPVAPLVTLLQRMPGMSAAKVGMVMGTMGSVTYIVSSVAPNVVGRVVTAGLPIERALLPCCVLGLTPVFALLLPEPE